MFNDLYLRVGWELEIPVLILVFMGLSSRLVLV